MFNFHKISSVSVCSSGAFEEALKEQDYEYMMEVESKIRVGIKLFISFMAWSRAKQQFEADRIMVKIAAHKLSTLAAQYPRKLDLFKWQAYKAV